MPTKAERELMKAEATAMKKYVFDKLMENPFGNHSSNKEHSKVYGTGTISYMKNLAFYTYITGDTKLSEDYIHGIRKVVFKKGYIRELKNKYYYQIVKKYIDARSEFFKIGSAKRYYLTLLFNRGDLSSYINDDEDIEAAIRRENREKLHN